jgi:hypothetical protein
VLLLILFCLAGSPRSALSMDTVTLRAGDFAGDLKFLSQYLRERRAFYELRYPLTKDLYVGRFDLNGDGQYELFLWHERPLGFSGSEPIHAEIYRKVGGQMDLD